MPLFEKKVEKVEVRKLSEIVFDMLSTNVPEAEILTTLRQSGLKDADARQVLEGAKAEYQRFASGKLTSAMDKLWDTKKQELRDYLASVSEASKKDLLLQLDLKILEQQKYTDGKVAGLRSEVDAVKSDLFNFKVTHESSVKRVEEEVESLKMARHIRVLLAICVILLGVSLAGYFAVMTKDVAVAGVTQDNMINLGVYLVLVIVGLILVKLGINIYLAKKKEFKQVGEVIPVAK